MSSTALGIDPNTLLLITASTMLVGIVVQMRNLIERIISFMFECINDVFHVVRIIEISGNDPIVSDFMSWVLLHKRRMLRYEMHTYPINQDAIRTHLDLCLSQIYWFRHGCRFILLLPNAQSRSTGSSVGGLGGSSSGGSSLGGGGGGGTGGGGTGTMITFWFVFWWSKRDIKHWFEQFLGQNRNLAIQRDGDLLIIKSYNCQGGKWEIINIREGRSLDSVYMSHDIKQEIVHDIQRFQSDFNKQRYKELGIPYRRGYLLYGPPGNGKSTLIGSLASEFKKNISVLNLNQEGMNDYQLVNAMKSLDRQSMLVLEDVDALFENRADVEMVRNGISQNTNRLSQSLSKTSKTISLDGNVGHNNPNYLAAFMNRNSTVTLSCFLNTLDGMFSVSGILVFMTTNYIQRLDSALFRPGRCDVWYEIEQCTLDQARQMIAKFFPTLDTVVRDTFLKQFQEKKISVAKLQSFFVESLQDPENILDKMCLLFPSANDNDDVDVMRHKVPDSLKIHVDDTKNIIN